MKLCTNGATRLVLLVGRWAIKVPRITSWKLFLHGLLANMQEAEFSKAGWPELCPVLWSIPGGLLVVMKRAVPVTDGWWKTRQDVIDRVFNPRRGYVVPVERKQDSFGWLDSEDGRLVAVDYGS
jgi:hypothetical protein